GTYWLESVVDPDNHFIELDDTNNIARILVNLSDDTNPNVLTPDAYEPNDSRTAVAGRPTGASNSPNLGPVGPETTLSGLTIDSSGNDDYFRFYLPATGTSSDFVRINFSHPQGDLDL